MALIASALLATVAGCAQMSAALGKQWIDVQLAPNTSIATARQVSRACSHVPNMPPYPVTKISSYANLVTMLRFDATNASPANMAELQRCLDRFPAAQSITLGGPGGDS